MATSKRGQNEGSIYKMKDGRWAAALTVGYFNGKQRRKIRYGKTREEVAKKLNAMLAEKDQGIMPTDDRQTLGQFLDSWLEESVKSSVRPRTYESYKATVDLHLKPNLGKERLSKLTVQHVNRLMADKRAGGLSATTVRYIRTVLRRALNVAAKWGLLTRNAAALSEPPKVERHRSASLDEEQARALLTKLQGHRLEALVSVAMAVGLRIGEALALTWADVSFEKKTLSITKQLQRIEGKLKVTEPKSSSGLRTISLPGYAIDVLRDHKLRQQLQDRPLAGSKWQETGYVFTNTIGNPMEPRKASRLFQEFIADEDLPKLRFHDLRHTCASLLLAQGVHPRVVMEILGHSQISMTMNTYSHVIPSVMADAAKQMDRMLGRNSRKVGKKQRKLPKTG